MICCLINLIPKLDYEPAKLRDLEFGPNLLVCVQSASVCSKRTLQGVAGEPQFTIHVLVRGIN
jgi:hypothetical protein